jgi:hypothetical protein
MNIQPDKKAIRRDFDIVGKRTARPDGIDKVTGRARFGADMTMPGMLWGLVLRSPHAHAKSSGSTPPGPKSSTGYTPL